MTNKQLAFLGAGVVLFFLCMPSRQGEDKNNAMASPDPGRSPDYAPGNLKSGTGMKPKDGVISKTPNQPPCYGIPCKDPFGPDLPGPLDMLFEMS
jgi:hypothetical protein